MKHPNSTSVSTPRRSFLKRLSAGALVTFTLPSFEVFSDQLIPSLPKKNAFVGEPDERYWEMVKKQFTVTHDLVMVNAANLCPSPYFIQDQVIAHTKNIGKDVSFQYREVYPEKRVKTLSALAEFIGVSKEEVTITRNTSESNSFIVNGLDLKSGDEIILWDQNHPTNGIAWEHRAKRYGFSIKRISVNSTPKSTDELIAPFANAITSKTKLIGFSQISNTSGIALPAKNICKMAKEKGIMTLVDGAQSFGMMDLNLKDMDCDFYSASTHKWLMGPLENGILYIRKEKMEKIWPTLIGAGWKDTHATVDEKFSTLGQRNETTTVGLPDILEFHNTLGKKNIEERVRKLTSYLKAQLQLKIPQAKFISPLAAELSAGIVIIELSGKPSKELFQKLYKDHGVACAATGGIRFSPHVYNTLADMDKIVTALALLST